MALDYNSTPGDYTYSRNSHGKSVTGVIKMGPTSKRDLEAQRSAGGADRQPGDQGGHLMAHRFGGRNDSSNLDAQAANINQKEQANVEKNVARLASDSNNTVAMSVTNYNSVGERPDATMIHVGVRNNTTGEIDEQHISFQNASHDLQQSWNDTVNQLDLAVDPSQDAGMTGEQRALANELCGAENSIDDSIGSGWGHTDFDASFLEAEPMEGETEEASSGMEISSDESNASDDSGTAVGPDGDDEGLGE